MACNTTVIVHCVSCQTAINSLHAVYHARTHLFSAMSSALRHVLQEDTQRRGFMERMLAKQKVPHTRVPGLHVSSFAEANATHPALMARGVCASEEGTPLGTIGLYLATISFFQELCDNRLHGVIDGETVLFLQDDVVLHAGWLEALLGSVGESLPADWEVARIGMWGERRPTDRQSWHWFRAVGPSGSGFTDGRTGTYYYLGAHAVLLQAGWRARRVCQHYASHQVCNVDKLMVDHPQLRSYVAARNLVSRSHFARQSSRVDINLSGKDGPTRGPQQEANVSANHLLGTASEHRPPERSLRDVVHVCTVAMGKAGAIRELELLLRSMRATSSADIVPHVLVSAETAALARALLNRTAAAWRASFTYETTAHEIEHLANVSFPGVSVTAHHSGPWGFVKTFSHRLFTRAPRCILIDTDILLGHDVGALWRQFDAFSESTLITLQLGRGLMHTRVAHVDNMCSCVSLQEFERMRSSDRWDTMMRTAWLERTALLPKQHEGTPPRVSNQGMYFLAARKFPQAVSHLNVSWNLEGCAKFHGCQFANAAWHCGEREQPQVHGPKRLFFGAMHANCMQQADVGKQYQHDSDEDAFSITAEDVHKWHGFDRYVKLVKKLSWEEVIGQTVGRGEQANARCALVSRLAGCGHPAD